MPLTQAQNLLTDPCMVSAISIWHNVTFLSKVDFCCRGFASNIILSLQDRDRRIEELEIALGLKKLSDDDEAITGTYASFLRGF